MVQYTFFEPSLLRHHAPICLYLLRGPAFMHTAMCNSVHLKNGSQTVQTAANQEVKVGNPPGPGKVVSSPRAEGLEASHRLRCRTTKPPEGKGLSGLSEKAERFLGCILDGQAKQTIKLQARLLVAGFSPRFFACSQARCIPRLRWIRP